MQNFSPLASKLREEFDVRDAYTHGCHDKKPQTVMIFLTHSVASLAHFKADWKRSCV